VFLIPSKRSPPANAAPGRTIGLTSCAANTYSPLAPSTSCTACPADSSTKTLTGQATCSCNAGGNATTTGGFYGNGLLGDGLVCTGTHRRCASIGIIAHCILAVTIECPTNSYAVPAIGNNASFPFCNCTINTFSLTGTATVETGACTGKCRSAACVAPSPTRTLTISVAQCARWGRPR
jgi:hypothetical protein